MNAKSILTATGPAVLLAAFSLVIDFTVLLPAWALVFTVALLSSLLTLIIRAFKPSVARTKPANSSTGRSSSTNTGTTTKAATKPASNNTSNNTSNNASGARKEAGSVKWFNASKGFGFITRANGEEIFVHFRSIVGQRSLRDGQKVEFAVTNGSKGLQAEDVVALN